MSKKPKIKNKTKQSKEYLINDNDVIIRNMYVIENKDVIVFKHEPYDQTGHITKKKHLIENWCDLLGIKFTNQQPEIHVNYIQKMTTGLWLREKPILLLQTNGGPLTGQT